jgi:hypothetical protein
MVNRPAGGDRSKKWERAPYDWYCESPRAVEQMAHGLAKAGIDFGDDLIWDPCCGRGNTLDVAKQYGHRTIGSDIIDRHPRHKFMRANILTQVSRMPVHPGLETSVWCNPPYSYEDDIAERIVALILERFNVRRAAFILPIAFLASQDRWTNDKFAGRWNPSQVGVYRERHSMPPGHLMDTMAKPFAGGMADYCVIVFTRPHRWRTEMVWLAPGTFPDPPRIKPRRSE